METLADKGEGMREKKYRKLLIVSAILHILIQIFISNGWNLGFWTILEMNSINFGSRYTLVHWLGMTIISAYIVSYVTLFFILKARNYDVNLPVFRKFTIKDCLYIMFIVIGFFIIKTPILDYKILANTYLQMSFDMQIFEKQELSAAKIYKFISILFLSPIFEELLFRHHILGGLQERYSQRTAIFVSSLLFGLIHFDGFVHIINTFIFGVVIAIFILKSKNFYHAILLHFTINLLFVWQTIFINQYMEFKTWLGVGFLYWVGFVLGLGLLIICFRTQKAV
jgi:membrane protease YdiL (CAAX protease family)